MVQRPPQPQHGEQAPWLTPSQWPAAIEGSMGAVLRAVGNLLVAISGDGRPQSVGPGCRDGAGATGATGRTTPRDADGDADGDDDGASDEPASTAAPAARRLAVTAASQQPQQPPPSPGEQDDVSLILADARSRAHEIIDQSVVQAEALLQQQSGGEAGDSRLEATVERIRHMVADLVAEECALDGRLDSIEALLRSREPASHVAAAAGRERAPAPAAEPPPPPPAAAPAGTPPATTRAAARPSSPVAPPSTGTPPAPPPPASMPPPAVEAAAPAASPDAAPPDAAPPETALPETASPETASPGHEAAAAVGPARTAVATTADVVPNGAGDAADAVAEERFSPEEGSVRLRVSPVSGFQGLMRVQDTLVRLRAVRDASVEAYSQGEARLRVQLAEPVNPASLAAAMGDGLGQEARVQSASLPERSLEVVLG